MEENVIQKGLYLDMITAIIDTAKEFLDKELYTDFLMDLDDLLESYNGDN